MLLICLGHFWLAHSKSTASPCPTTAALTVFPPYSGEQEGTFAWKSLLHQLALVWRKRMAAVLSNLPEFAQELAF